MPLSNRFIFCCYLGLALAALALLQWLPVGGAIDLALIRPWYNTQGQFFLRDNWYLDTLNHDYVKKMIFVVFAAHIVLFLKTFKSSAPRQIVQQQRLQHGYMITAAALSSTAVGLWKSQSDHACPWNLLHQHGTTLVWQLHSVAGHCFPGGHASAGFALLAGFFAFYASARQRAYFYLLAALILGFAMGWAQMMRGAHFFSHNVWTLWTVFTVNTLLYHAFKQRFLKS